MQDLTNPSSAPAARGRYDKKGLSRQTQCGLHPLSLQNCVICSVSIGTIRQLSSHTMLSSKRAARNKPKRKSLTPCYTMLATTMLASIARKPYRVKPMRQRCFSVGVALSSTWPRLPPLPRTCTPPLRRRRRCKVLCRRRSLQGQHRRHSTMQHLHQRVLHVHL